MAETIYPSSTTWITPRTELGQITTSNCSLILPQKIDRINKVLVNASNNNFQFAFNKNGHGSFSMSVDFSNIYSDQACTNNIFDKVDITKYVVEEAKYNTLNKAVTWNGSAKPSDGKLYLSNTWYYTHNGENIYLSNDKHDYWMNVPDLLLEWCFFDLLEKYPIIYVKRGVYVEEYTKEILEGSTCTVTKPTLTQWQFRVYYTPLGESVKLQVPKTNPQANQFCIPYSQQQPIVDNVTLGREMQSVANRAGCETKEVVRTLRSIKEYRKPGTVYFEKDSSGNPTGNVWRLTSNHIEIYSETFIQVVETWSKNWSYRSQNVPIDREFRSWNIPADIVQRNLLWQDYCLLTRKKISKEDWEDDSLLTKSAKEELMHGLDDTYSGIATECNNMWFYRTKDVTVDGIDLTRTYGAVLSCSAFGFGNSLVFSGKTKDNLSAGIQRVQSDNKDTDYEFCKDVYYCDDDGKLKEMYIQVGSALDSLDDEATYSYPECLVYKKGTATYKRQNFFATKNAICLFENNKSFKVLKDPCEQLNFTYQLHLLTDDGMLVIGSTWAASNPLVRQRDKAQIVKVWKLTQPLPQGAQVMTYAYGDDNLDDNLKNRLFKVHIPQDDSGEVLVDDSTIQFNIAKADGTESNDGKGVCVTDEHNNVLIAFNSNAPATFNVKFTHDYGAIAKAMKK